MIGLLFLAVAILWLVLVYQVVRRIPIWLTFKKHVWLVQALVAVVLLVGPFVDEVVGMRQFKKLCEERTAITVSPAAGSVQRARDVSSEKKILPGYWINIWAGTRTFFDADTGKEFLSYPVYRTQGGRIAGLALMGGWHSCSAESPANKNHEHVKNIRIYRQIINGDTQ